MKQKQMMIIAIACGLLCAGCVALFMMGVHGEADAARAEALARFGGEQVEAYIATRDIVAGERVDLSAVETKLWVADLLPERAVRSGSDAVGKTATSTIYKGEVITEGRFEVGKDAIEVPAGKQAVSVPAKAVQAVGGAIRAGMSVDIYSSGGSSTTSLASGVTVLDSSVNSSGSDGWITFAVDPDKVQELIAASNKTTLYFTLPGQAAPTRSSDAEQGEDTSSGASFSGDDASGSSSVGSKRGSSESPSETKGSSADGPSASGSSDGDFSRDD